MEYDLCPLELVNSQVHVLPTRQARWLYLWIN